MDNMAVGEFLSMYCVHTLFFIYSFQPLCSNFFGGFGFHFGQADSGHHEIPRGGSITMDLEVMRERESLGVHCYTCPLGVT